MKKYFSNLGSDLPSSLVVFLVALPLCLGVGLASTNTTEVSGMPNVFAGIIAGVVGGVVVGSLSGSRIGVAGPAAGLITIVVGAIVTLGSFEAFLLAVVLSGILQVIAGFSGLGIIGNYFPSAVIKGMLAGIGITLILKETPHAVGYDADFFGDEAFFQPDGHNTLSELYYALGALNWGAVIIFVLSLIVLISFETKTFKRIRFFKFVPGALIVVLLGIGLNQFFKVAQPDFFLMGKHAVQLPRATSATEFFTFFTTPDFSAFSNVNVYIIAATIALVGSLETLLSVEATDKIDPEKNHTPTNRELKAQGVGNIISGLIGGLPVTQVIVRSSANVNSGAKTKASAVMHGLLLGLCVMLIPHFLNLIPLASLAAILMMVGYKLARISVFTQLYKLGWEQFLPFIVTIIGVLFKDLLFGIGMGIVVAVFFILRKNYRNNFTKTIREDDRDLTTTLTLSEEVTFLNKPGIVDTLSKIPVGSKLVVDGSNSKVIDYDILELLHEFCAVTAKEKDLRCELINIPEPGIRPEGH